LTFLQYLSIQETITHVITSCPLYNEIRKEHFVKIKGTVITAIGFDCWKINFNKKDIICQLVIDKWIEMWRMLHRDCHPYQPLFSTVEV
jgi:hypothetical protein